MELYFESNVTIDTSFNLMWLIWGLLFVFLIVFRNRVHAVIQSTSATNSRRVQVIITLTCLLFFVGDLISAIDSWSFRNDVVEAERKKVAGIISSFEFDQTNEKLSRQESFYVNEVYFSYNNIATNHYFFANRNFKDKKIHDGVAVEIEYVTVDDRNYILTLYVDN